MRPLGFLARPLVAAAAVLVTLIAGGFGDSGAEAPATTTGSPAVSAASGTGTGPPEPTIVTDGRSETTDLYTYDVAVPVLRGLEDQAAQDSVNAKIATWAEAKIAQFVSTASEGLSSNKTAPDGTTSTPAANFPSRLEVTYEVGVIRPDLLSLGLAVDEDFSFAASSNVSVETFTFDLDRGKRLVLGDLFDEGAYYFVRLASVVHPRISETFDNFGSPSAVHAGTQPTENNFDHWLLGPENLQVNFHPGQVAPLAAGIIEVSVPYAELADLIDRDGPLESLLSDRVLGGVATQSESPKTQRYSSEDLEISFEYPRDWFLDDDCADGSFNGTVALGQTAAAARLDCHSDKRNQIALFRGSQAVDERICDEYAVETEYETRRKCKVMQVAGVTTVRRSGVTTAFSLGGAERLEIAYKIDNPQGRPLTVLYSDTSDDGVDTLEALVNSLSLGSSTP